MAEVNRYVDTDSGNAGNGGTSWLDAWDTFSTAESQNQNLDTANNYWIVHMRGSAADTTAVTIDGWTLSTDDYLEFRVDAADRHSGKWSTTKYRLSVTDATALTISDQYVKLTGLQIEVVSLSAAARRACTVTGIAAGGSWLYITYCIMRLSADSYAYIVLNLSDADTVNAYLWNSVFHHRGDQTASSNNSNVSINAANINIYNCTAFGGYQGFRGINTGAGTYAFKNCIATDTTSSDYLGAAGPTYDWDYNGSQDNSADDKAGDGNLTAQTFAFVDSANTDMHLTALSDGIGDADSASVGGAFSDDIDGVARGATWDMGADQYTAGTTTSVINQILSTYRARKRKNESWLIW